jgi:transposase
VARLVGVDRRSVRRWNEAYRKQRTSGVAARAVPGRPCKLSRRQRAHLEGMLLRGAAANGLESDLWTCPRVAQVIARVGWAGPPQRPTRRALERDEEGIQRWIRQEWPRIKKKPGA